VNGKHAITTAEFAELALGVDWELFDGVEGESPEECAARVEAARDMLSDLWATDRELAAHAERLLGALWSVDPATAVCAELLTMTIEPPVGRSECRERVMAA